MTFVRRRTLARAAVTAAALAATGAFFAAPAQASDNVDLAVKISGTTIATGTTAKVATVTISNTTAGSSATGVMITFDLGGLDQSIVAFRVSPGCSPVDAQKKSNCTIGELAGGANLDVGFNLEKITSGVPGKVVVSVKHDGTDPDATNDVAEAVVTLGDSGADLLAFAPDVYQLDANGDFTDRPVPVGGTSAVYVLVVNQGDSTARGVRVTIKLPDHVTFTEPEAECTHAAGDKTTTCAYDQITLIPNEQVGKVPGDSGLWFFFPVKVAGDAPASGSLTGGVAAAEPIAQETILEYRPTTTKLPHNATKEPPGATFADADPTDNTDEFSVFVAKPGGSGGSLPITGVQVGVIGAVGVAIVAIGGALILLSRRRRIVTVTPEDESTEK